MVEVAGVRPFSFSEAVEDLIGKTTCRAVQTPDERERVFKLRYDAYAREGAIARGPDERFTDPLDRAANAMIFGVYVEDRLAASMRLHIVTRDTPDYPGQQVFSDYLAPLLDVGQTFIDPTRFVIDLDSSRQFPKLPYVTVRIAWMASAFFRADYLLATVRSEHQAFYKRLFGHRLVCDARRYPMLAKPISLMMLDFPAERERVERRYPFFLSTPAERSALFSESARLP